MKNNLLYSKNKILRHLKKLDQLKRRELISPVLARIDVTNACNHNCVYCMYQKSLPEFGLCDSFSFKDQIPEKKLKNLLMQLKKIGVKAIMFAGGGEPTLYRNLYGILEKIQDTEIVLGMVTNGRRLEDVGFTKGLKKRGLDYITFSIEGENQLTHDSMTQIYGSYYETISGIKNAMNERINVATNTVISSENINNLERIVHSLKDRGVKDMGFNICGICISEESNNSYAINPKEASNAFIKIYNKFNKEVNLKLITPVPFFFFEEEIKKELIEKKIISGGPCQLVHGGNFVIDYNGDIVPCTHLTGFPLFNLFNEDKITIKEEFIQLYNNELANKFRKTIGRYPSEKCNTCNESCSGGCPLFWLKFNSDKEIRGIKND